MCTVPGDRAATFAAPRATTARRSESLNFDGRDSRETILPVKNGSTKPNHEKNPPKTRIVF